MSKPTIEELEKILDDPDAAPFRLLPNGELAPKPKKIARITIEFIEHKDHRYPTCGDWLYRGEELVILVSKTQDERHQQLVAVHELVEVLLCNQNGVTQEAVDEFDIAFEKQRDYVGRLDPDDHEPGDDPAAPYQREHSFATAVERMMCAEMRVKWMEYEDALGDLDQ